MLQHRCLYIEGKIKKRTRYDWEALVSHAAALLSATIKRLVQYHKAKVARSSPVGSLPFSY